MLRVAGSENSGFQLAIRNSKLATAGSQTPPIIKAGKLILKSAILNHRRTAASSNLDSIRRF